MQTIEGALVEIQRLIEELDVTSEIITSDYAFNYFLGEVDGKPPEDKGKLLRSVEEALAWWPPGVNPNVIPFRETLTGLLPDCNGKFQVMEQSQTQVRKMLKKLRLAYC